MFVPGNISLNRTLITGFVNQNNSAQSNIFLGKVGIGTTLPGSYALNVNGDMLLSNAILYGKIGIGTLDISSYTLNVSGNTQVIGNINVTQNLTALKLIGNGESITNINYGNISNPPPILSTTGGVIDGNLTQQTGIVTLNGATTFTNNLIQNTGTVSIGGTTNFTNYVSIGSTSIQNTLYPLYIYSSSPNISNQLYINSVSNNASCGFNYNTNTGSIGIGYTGYYQNNLFLESKNKIVFNTGGVNISSIPKMSINTDGTIGIGISTPPEQLLDVGGNIKSENLYLYKSPLESSAIYFNQKQSASLHSLFNSNLPSAMYFAEDYNSVTNKWPNYINNGKDATTSGTILLTKASGNGASGAISYISGTSTSFISFPDNSLNCPAFTILVLARFIDNISSSLNNKRILKTVNNKYIFGHNYTKLSIINNDLTVSEQNLTTNINNWYCIINRGTTVLGEPTSNNILINGSTGIILTTNPTQLSSPTKLLINDISDPSNNGSWAVSCVMIWDKNLTSSEMNTLNNIIENYKSSGTSIKQFFYDECIIENRNYNPLNSNLGELLLFKGNNGDTNLGPDRIRLKSGNIVFETFSGTIQTSDKNLYNPRMIIDNNGNVGIGTTLTNSYNLFVPGSTNLNTTLITGFVNQNNSAQSNIFLGNVGIGTTIPNSYNLFVPGDVSLNRTLISGFINQNNSSQSNIFSAARLHCSDFKCPARPEN